MSDESIEVLAERIKHLSKQLETFEQDIRRDVDTLKSNDALRRIDEKKNLRAGLTFLGSIVLALIGILWGIVSGHIGLGKP